MQRYRMTVAYDGSAYAGWQIQPRHVTVQERLLSAIERVTGERTVVHGSGRTDRGVHARGQVAHFDLQAPREPQKLREALNGVLPPDIRVLALGRASQSFHARHGASGKEYRYFIWNDEIVPPPLRLYRAHIRKPLNVSAMKQAAASLVGKHDFAAFAANPDRIVESTVRTLRKLDVRRRGREICIVAQADGFLYKMVRSLAGYLIRVGEGSVPPNGAGAILKSVQRTARVPTAAAQGLFLWEVFYPRRAVVGRGASGDGGPGD